MNSEKKAIIKRLAIFLLISFPPFMILVPVLWAVYGEPLYTGTDEKYAVIIYIVSVFGMMIPAMANLITRLVTKEGFSDSYLGVHVKGKAGYWAASVIIPLVENVAALFLLWAVFMNDIPFDNAFPGIDFQKAGSFLLVVSYSVIIFFPAFGEEWGWRGYMMPKLLKLMPKPMAIVVGGVIWGLWHAPLTIAGHNFGTDYPGYPFTGILIMCCFCVLMNCLLTLVTEKTRSIYPASFIHMLHNNVYVGTLLNIFGSDKAILKTAELDLFKTNLLVMSVILLTAVVSFILFVKKEKVSNLNA